MQIKIKKGSEYSLVIEDVYKSICNNEFMKSSYEQAFSALADYISKSKRVRKKADEADNDRKRYEALYRSPQNIIAFVGVRGSGKTSTMLSFSEELKMNTGRWGRYETIENVSTAFKNIIKDPISKQDYLILDPIDPTAIEDCQSFLGVVLSRLISYAEETWKKQSNFYYESRTNENKTTRDKILEKSRRCLEEINLTKKKDETAADLVTLQKIGDSAVLKKDIYDLVNYILSFFNPGCVQNRYLVLQIDDTDCQIKNAYRIMEDIRKYLTLPNIVILMSTDMEMLRTVIKQNFADAFKTSIDKAIVDIQEVLSQGEKYLTKMFPQLYIVNIPTIDDLIHDSYEDVNLNYTLNYTDIDIDGAFKTASKKDIDIQKNVLRLIYRKTHIIFTTHKAYLSSIIPTTIRGLSRFLAVLDSMEDVPEIDFSEKNVGLEENEFLAQQIEIQAPILQKNLQTFETYFITEWIPVKLSRTQIGIIKELKELASGEYNIFLYGKIYNFYFSNNHDRFFDLGTILNSNQLGAVSFATTNGGTQYIQLDELICSIIGDKKGSDKNKAFRDNNDFLFMFAVRTLLSIAAHKDANRIRKKTVSEWRENRERGNIVFKYYTPESAIPVGMYLDNTHVKSEDVDSFTLVSNSVTFENKKRIKGLSESYYIAELGQGTNIYYYSFLGGIFGCLDMGKEKYEAASQVEIYKAQEAALILATNFEIQRRIRKTVTDYDITVSKADQAKLKVSKYRLPLTDKYGFLFVQKTMKTLGESVFGEGFLNSILDTDSNSVWYKFAEKDSEFWNIKMSDRSMDRLDGGASKRGSAVPKLIEKEASNPPDIKLIADNLMKLTRLQASIEKKHLDISPEVFKDMTELKNLDYTNNPIEKEKRRAELSRRINKEVQKAISKKERTDDADI